MTAEEVFNQTDGEVTKDYYAQLDSRGPAGQLATALFRAQKRSTAAKRYRGGKFRRAAYDVKNWSLSEVCRILSSGNLPDCRWGWKIDRAMEERGDPHHWVLYIDITSGQCSFHSSVHLEGPEYPGEWDGTRLSKERILAYCDEVMKHEGSEIVADNTIHRDADGAPNSAPNRIDLVRALVWKDRKKSRLEQELERGGGRLAL